MDPDTSEIEPGDHSERTEHPEYPEHPGQSSLERAITSPRLSATFRRTHSTAGLEKALSSLFRRSSSVQSGTKDNQLMTLANFAGPVNGPQTPSPTPGSTTPQHQAPTQGKTTSNPRWSLHMFSLSPRAPSPPTPPEFAENTSDPDPPPSLAAQGRSISSLSFKDRAASFIHVRSPGHKPNYQHLQCIRSGSVDSLGATRSQRKSSFDKSSLEQANTDLSLETSITMAHGYCNSTGGPNDSDIIPAERLFPPDAGTGAKARRMSVNLPDNFNVYQADLLSEFEYHHKFFGRHGRHLGKGTTSKVSLMFRKGFPNELYAVKEFRSKSNQETQQEYEQKIKSEYSIAKSLHHPNVVETFHLCTDHGRWNHVMEYCGAGDLFHVVHKGFLKSDARLPDRLCIFRQIVQGVAYLHANGIAHRDIKLENLLVTREGKIKITDFGVSDVFSGTHPGLRQAGGQCGRNMGPVRFSSPGICGSEPYIAPEVLDKRGSYDPRALDVWSTAIVMLYMTFGGAIWCRADAAAGNVNYNSLVKAWDKWLEAHQDDPTATTTDTDYPKVSPFDRHIRPPALRRVLVQMLNPDPTTRISIADVARNRFVRNIECCQLEGCNESVAQIDAAKQNACAESRKIALHNHLAVTC